MIDLQLEKAAKLNFQTQCCVEKGNCRKHCDVLCHFLYSSEVSKVISFWGCDKVIKKSHLKIYIVQELAKAYNFLGYVKVIKNGKGIIASEVAFGRQKIGRKNHYRIV